MVFGLVYFPSVLFLVAPSGAEGARRSWAFTYVGIALIGAAVVQKRQNAGPARWQRPATLAVAAILLMGNVGGGLNDPYRFPGPFRWGTDTNSASAEARTVAEALTREAGPVRAVADRYTVAAAHRLRRDRRGDAVGGVPRGAARPVARRPEPLVGRDALRLALRLRRRRHAHRPADHVQRGQFRLVGPAAGRATPRAYLDRLDAVPWASQDHLDRAPPGTTGSDLLLLGRALQSG